MLHWPFIPCEILYRAMTFTWVEGLAHPFIAFPIYLKIYISLHGCPRLVTFVSFWNPCYCILPKIGSLDIIHPQVKPHASLLIILIILHRWIMHFFVGISSIGLSYVTSPLLHPYHVYYSFLYHHSLTPEDINT